MSFQQSVSETWHDTKQELRTASLLKRLAFGALGLALLYEWGPAYESVLGQVTRHVLEHTHSSVYLTAAASGGMEFIGQAIFGIFAAACIYYSPHFMRRLNKRFNPAVATKRVPLRRKGLYERFISTFNLGTITCAIIDNAQQKRSFGQNVAEVSLGAALVGASVAGLGAGVALLARAGAAYGFSPLAHGIILVVTSPVFYVSLFVADVAYRHRRLVAKKLIATFRRSRRIIMRAIRKAQAGIAHVIWVRGQALEFSTTLPDTDIDEAEA